ncbi:GDSL-type esterase/lipase family protein [Roseiterribacter gracilis]|uniref:Lysophospholipase n=1 Tax=Roseiterribacter gracilis TaxID=2812848 RepID=A0A8S8XEZ2_9PROT|nr:lysophospholipase [Rhodospirillales bacterium TMPK1]
MTTPARAEPRLQLFLVGDSTMAADTGYGAALFACFGDEVVCYNRAYEARSTLSYRADGLWDDVLQLVRASPLPSYVLIQFGHNDAPGHPGRSTDLVTEFPANLERYVAELRAAGGTPVLVTPLVRRHFTNFRVRNELAPWAAATRAVAARTQTALLDLNTLSEAVTNGLGPFESLRLALDEAPDNVVAAAKTGTTIYPFDYTHLGPEGATFYANIVREELVRLLPVLRPYLRS